MAITHSGRDDAADDPAGFVSIGVDDGQCDPLGDSDGGDTALSVVPTGVLAFERGPLEDHARKLEIEASLSKIPSALPFVPTETHK
jgi:hypothetical protein